MTDGLDWYIERGVWNGLFPCKRCINQLSACSRELEYKSRDEIQLIGLSKYVNHTYVLLALDFVSYSKGQ